MNAYGAELHFTVPHRFFFGQRICHYSINEKEKLHRTSEELTERFMFCFLLFTTCISVVVALQSIMGKKTNKLKTNLTSSILPLWMDGSEIY